MASRRKRDGCALLERSAGPSHATKAEDPRARGKYKSKKKKRKYKGSAERFKKG